MAAGPAVEGAAWTLVPVLGIDQPGGGIDVDDADGQESMLLVLAGTFEIKLDGRELVRLRRGEGAIYRCANPLRVRNVDNRIGQALAISLRQRTSS